MSPASLPLVLSRRHVLLGGAALLVSGCSVFGDRQANQSAPEVPGPDPLLPLSAAATADAALATQLAAISPAQAVALQQIAAERSAHAQALEAEITRAAGSSGAPPTPLPASFSLTPGPIRAPSIPAPAIPALQLGLRDNQRIAAELARTVVPYRAGLLGSVAAACAAQLAVLL